MATLQATRQGSACTAKARLKSLPRKPAFDPIGVHSTPETPAERPPFPPASNQSQPDHVQLSLLELRQLLLQTASIYPGWQLVSIQHRSLSDVLVASLVRSQDGDNPTRAIQEGRVLQIIMDTTGDLRIHHPHRRHAGRLAELFRWLATVFHPRSPAPFAQTW